MYESPINKENALKFKSNVLFQLKEELKSDSLNYGGSNKNKQINEIYEQSKVNFLWLKIFNYTHLLFKT